MSSLIHTTPSTDTADEELRKNHQAAILRQISLAMSSAAIFFSSLTEEEFNAGGRCEGAATIMRVRKNIEQYINVMDERYFRRKYRMTKTSFWTLLDIICDHMPSTGEDRTRGAVPNGPITKAARLSMALRYFAGGDPLDISDVHGVGDTEVTNSVWIIVDAIHSSKELDIRFPETWEEQTECMLEFQAKSSININCCIGTIDGMLLWINKPTVKDQKVIGFGSSKFFCGRKMKYGLNMMGVCDARRRFTWVELRFPGAASDFYAFEESNLKKKIEKKKNNKSFLRPGYCLFGDNAYVNSPYMCTPWRNVGSGPKDAMNFFHSSLRIIIECAFGILVHRWGMLRKPIAVNIPIHKITSLVLALCKLHNFCIDHGSESVDSPTSNDITNITLGGGLFLPRMDKNKEFYWECDDNPLSQKDRLDELLDGGNHMDDHTRNHRRKYRFDQDLPCHKILQHVIKYDYRRPALCVDEQRHH